MAQHLPLLPSASPGSRRRSDGSVRECLFFPVLERNEQERLEALVRRRTGGAERRGGGGGGGGDGRDAVENRPKRWTWGGPPDGEDGNPKTPPSHAIGSALPNELPAASSPGQSQNAIDFLTPPMSDQPISKRLSNSSAALHSADRPSPGTQKQNRGSADRRSIAGLPDESRGTSKTHTTDRNMADSMRRLDSPTTPTRNASFRGSKGLPGTPKRVRSSKSRAQSPCSPGQYPSSPIRHRAITPGTDGNHAEGKGHATLERKTSKAEAPEKKMPKSTSRELGAESPGTPTGRSVGGTTDAEEASRLLAERRRLARVQKEQEERQRLEDERLRLEEEQRREEEAREQQVRAALQAEEDRLRREEDKRNKEEEDKRLKEQRWKDMQDQLDREREEAFLRAQREAERKQRERELQHLQEEAERQQRKKRIEEIMKRTRRNEADTLISASVVCEGRVEQTGEGVLEDVPTPVSPPAAPPASPPADPSSISLGPLETKSCGDEMSDGVQSMDVSPVSRDDQCSGQDFSPLSEGLNQPTLEHFLVQGAVTPPYPKLQAGSGTAGELNKNLLIQAYTAAAAAAAAGSASSASSSSSSSSHFLHTLASGTAKLDIQ